MPVFKWDNRKVKIISLPSYDYYKTEDGKIFDNLEDAKKAKNIIIDPETKEPKVFNDTKVEVYKELTVWESEKLADLAKATNNELTLLLETLENAIKDWNFTDEKGEKVKISKENLKLFPNSDLNAIVEAMTGKTIEELADGNKKKLI